MKIQFSRTVPYTPEWNGNKDLPDHEQIKCVIKPMVIADLVTLLDVIGSTAKGGGTSTTLSASEAANMIGACKDLLPRYVSITGLHDDDGPVLIDHLTQFAQYMPLASETIMACATISSPSAATEGNLKAPPV
jgi:hypothetical protein